MPVRLLIDNYPRLNIKEESSLAEDVVAGATEITLSNNESIAAEDIIVVGRRGSETGELTIVESVEGAQLVTTQELTLDHSAYEDVTALFGDQIQLYRSPNVNGLTPSDSTFNTIGDPSPIDPDQAYTEVSDDTGDSDWWYKYTYRSSVTNGETDLSQVRAVRGGNIGNYVSIDDIRAEAGFSANRNITDAYIEPFRRAAQDQINSSLSGFYSVPFAEPINAFIEQIAKMLAAGHLQQDQYGPFTTTSTTNGKVKIDWAEAQLKSIRDGEVKLTDLNGAPLPGSNGSGSGVEGGGLGFSGYPNNAEQGGGFKFESDKRY